MSRLTEPLCTAVREGTLKSHDVPDRLNNLLPPCPHSKLRQRDEWFRVEKAVINSEEWTYLLKQLAECEAVDLRSRQLRTSRAAAQHRT